MNQGTIARFMRYCLAGGTAAIVDIGGFRLLTLLHISVVSAAVCSFSVSVIVNFLITSRIVFCARPTPRIFGIFALGACIGMLVNVAVTVIAIAYFALPHLFAKTVAVGTTLLFNFWINVQIVFRNSVDCVPRVSRRPSSVEGAGVD